MADNKNTNFHTLLKSFARANAVPLDRDEIWESISAVEQYMNSPLAYAGQTVKVKMEDGKYHSYTLQPHKDGEENKLILETLKGEIDESKLKKYVVFTDTLPEEGQESEVIYFLVENETYTGYIWNGSEYVKISNENTSDFSELARLDGAIFTGDVILAADPIEELGAATKQYVDRVASAGGTDPAEAIAKAKAEAISEANNYTNTALTWGTF